MKTTARKVLCIVMVLVLALTVGNAVITGAFNGSNGSEASIIVENNNIPEDVTLLEPVYTSYVVSLNALDITPDIYTVSDISTMPARLANADWWEAFRASGAALDIFDTYMMPSGMTVAEIEALLPPGVPFERAFNMRFSQERDMYFYPVYGMYYNPQRDMWFDAYRDTWHRLEDLTFLWDVPHRPINERNESAEVSESSEMPRTPETPHHQDLYLSAILAAGQADWTNHPYYDLKTMTLTGIATWGCPDVRDYFLTYGKFIDFTDYLDYWDYKAFRESGMRLAEFQAYEAARLAAIQSDWLARREMGDYGTIGSRTMHDYDAPANLRDMPFVPDWMVFASEELQETRETGEAAADAESITTWACPCEEEYYLTHGRLRNLADYLHSVAEYEVWRATGMRLKEFTALRTSGVLLTDIMREHALTWSDLPSTSSPDAVIEFESYNYNGQKYEFEMFYFNDLPIVYGEEWLENEAILPFFMPLSTPWLVVQQGPTTSNSVSLTGTVNNIGGVPITQRGFWIARGNEVNFSEIIVNTASNVFGTTIGGLTPNTQYRARAIARGPGMTGAWQSPYIRFFTLPPNRPGAPTNLRPTPGIGQMTITWSAPFDNGGVPITGYQVSLNNGQWLTAQSWSSHVFTGLQAGSNTFRVRAVNSAGPGTEAIVVASPIAPPVANPPSLWVHVDTNTITTNSVFVSGGITNTGGAHIIERGFWIRREDQHQARFVDAYTSQYNFSRTITGLTPNSTYLVRAVARNNGNIHMGQSSYSQFRTRPVFAQPGIPQVWTVTRPNEATLHWNAPSDGGSPIIRYEVSLNGGAWVTAQSTVQHTFTGLTNTTHTFSVRAVNAAGAGAPASITSAPALTVSRGTTTSTSVALTGTIINTGNAPITSRGFWITRGDLAYQWEVELPTTSNTFTHTISGLTPGAVYHVSAFARTAAGFGQSNVIIFATQHIQPTLTATRGTTTSTTRIKAPRNCFFRFFYP